MKTSCIAIIILSSLAALLAIANADDGGNTTAPASQPPLPPASPPPAPAPAAWTDVNDKSIQQVGQFAVRIYGLSTGRIYLQFVNVGSGQTQPYNGGYNYRLVLTVAGPGTTTARYDAAVWGILGTTSWKLYSFTLANITPLILMVAATFLAATNADGNTTAPASSPPPSPAAAAWTAVANVNDKSIQQVGQSAVRIYGLSTGKIYLKFVNVVRGQTQPNNGGYNYRLVITVAGPGTTAALYDAFMWGILGTTNWKLMYFTLAK
uniref:Cystatin domain-containing protein n=1 Tax=Leersia perrieri TaxID=77586 RepID=A0A0D9VQ31_9ORYZ